MDVNFLFSMVLYVLISVLLLLSLKTYVATKWETKISHETFLNLQKRLDLSKQAKEQILEKNAYLENYNLELFNKMFEIIKELLLTKKFIFEEHYN